VQRGYSSLGRLWHVDLAFFWHVGISQWYQCSQRSPVFARIPKSHAGEVNYEIDCHSYNKVYYVANAIYPKWSTFVKKSVTLPHRRNLGLPSAGRVISRMSSGHLVRSNNVLQSPDILIFKYQYLRCGRSWMLVWSCTSWSSRGVSKLVQRMMIIHMIARALQPKLITNC
jgi:hypothetical protein